MTCLGQTANGVLCVFVCVLHIKPFFLPDDISSTPSACVDSSSYYLPGNRDTRRSVNEERGGLTLAVGRVRSKKNKIEKKKHQKIRPAQDTARYLQQPGDRDHLETAYI